MGRVEVHQWPCQLFEYWVSPKGPPLVPAIQAAHETALRGLSGKGHRAKWWIPALSLEADKWAVITARSALTGIAPDMQDARPTTSVALNIASAAKLQREFDLWKARESKESREAQARGEHRANLYQVMLRSVKKVDKRTARKWMLLSDNIDHLDWSKDERISVGMLMLSILAEHGGGWFELAYIRKSTGRGTVTERVIRLTEAGRRWINNHNAMTELQRPWLLPMLCPPKAWRWVDAETEEPDSQASEDTPVPTPHRAGQEEVHA